MIVYPRGPIQFENNGVDSTARNFSFLGFAKLHVRSGIISTFASILSSKSWNLVVLNVPPVESLLNFYGLLRLVPFPPIVDQAR